VKDCQHEHSAKVHYLRDPGPVPTEQDDRLERKLEIRIAAVLLVAIVAALAVIICRGGL
jgi:hypothetical protein